MKTHLKTALKHFYDQVGEKYPEEEQVYQTLRGQLRRQFILDHILKWHGSFLDLGCNQGMYLNFYENGRRFGVDLSLPVVQKAHHRSFNPPPPFFIVGDAERLHCFRPNSFQNVLCSEVLEHCLYPEAVLAGIARILKPGGVLLLTTPNYKSQKPDWIDPGILKNYGIQCECDHGYYHSAHRPEELKLLAENAGLLVLEIGTLEKEIKYAAKIPAAVLLMSRWLNRIFFHSEKFDQWNEQFFEKFCLTLYAIARDTGIDRYLVSWIRAGVRSYILAKKPDPAVIAEN